MRRSFLLSFLLISLATATAAQADSFKTVDTAAPQEVVAGMSNKVVRGAANITTGWLELPKQIYETFHEDGVASGLFVGPLKGVGMTLVRTVGGVVELGTFFVPLPGFYDPLITPDYVWKEL